MIFILNTIILFLCVLLISADYNYKNADEWKNENPQCGGSKQSPIDVYFDKTQTSGEITFEHIFDTVPERMILKNDGHTVKLIYEWADDEKNIPYGHGDPIEGEYVVHSYQFRWGTDKNAGSEHQISGKSYALEMQIVAVNNEFDSYEEAEISPKGLLMVALFFNIGTEENEFIAALIEKFPEIMEPGTATELEPFEMGKYLEKGKPGNKVIYDGSLTHPPCYETVTWMISDKVRLITEEQLLAFKNLNLLYKDDHNNRPLQDLNDRTFTFAS